jgi:carboxypeptidase Taq
MDFMTKDSFAKMHEISRHARTLEGVASLLGWDRETYMPPAAAEIRGEQLKTLAGLIHKERTSPKYAKALAALIDLKSGKIVGKGLSGEQQAAAKMWRRDYLKETALPKSFVEEFTKHASQSILVWREAKAKNAFHHFAPFLDKMVSLCRKKADYLGYRHHPYDALLDLYEPEATSQEISLLFGHLGSEVAKLLKKIVAKKQVDDRCLFGKFDADKQLELGRRFLGDMGYDLSKGRLDLSTHPFSSACHPSDSRVTTRIHAKNLMSSLSATLHEGGHGLYEMGLPVHYYGSPLSEAISYGIHESQSRWWETRIGQSKPFWHYYLPLLKKTFKGQLEVSLEPFYRAINKVEPSFIRVDADEVTYTLHVILRFELEMALMEGSLRIRDIPEAWNAKMQELLGITPKNASEGCLQDIHWSMGGLGYFPTYTLGNLYAAHLFKGFAEAHPDWVKRVEKGELLFVTEWLHDQVWRHGRRYSALELLKRATGTPFSATPFIEYLQNKYSEIYKI